MQKIGIFGGSFNPPHMGHQRLALLAADTLGLDKVLIMPTCIPPHKQCESLASAHDRAAMCRLGLCPDKRFEVSMLEIDRGKKSYTVDTLEQLGKMFIGAEFYLIIGSDMLATFNQWHRWEDILNLAHVCAATRNKDRSCTLDAFTPEQAEKITILNADPLEISSSEIRAKIIAGDSTEGLLDSRVRGYIDETRLYDALLEPYRALLRQRLNDKRLYHSECVSRSARELAKKYGADETKATVAGLVHDIMKNTDERTQRAVISQAGIVLCEEEKDNLKVLHSISGEAFLRVHTDINDEEIFSAVRRHTTGAAGMSLLDKVIYIADFISADRDYPDVDEVRKRAEINLDDAILYTSGYTICRLVSKNTIIHPATMACYNDMLLKRKGK